MSDRQELIDWLRHWKHEVPTTREREEMIEAMRDAATALERAHGVPREPTRDWIEDASHENGRYQNQCVSCGEFFVGHKRRVACKLCAIAHAAPAAPTREPVSAATPRDEQDARRLQWLIDNGYFPGGGQFWWANNNDYNAKARAAIDAALAEPKR